jgi:hypothetical protein
MRAEDLVFWIDFLPDPVDDSAGVLCRRHADSMVVPRGWTLDDLRDPDLHLFRPPVPASPPRTRAPRAPRDRVVSEQLRLDEDVDLAAAAVAALPDGANGDTPPASASASGNTSGGASPVESGPWSPEFDEADDLDGLLTARGPLLSRAFRTAERPAE